MTEIVVSVLLFIGVFFMVVGSVGLIRLPDVYNRLHATTKSSTLGVVGILLASVVFHSVYQGSFTIKQIAAITFLYLTSPVGAHMIARAAYLIGIPLTERTIRDDYKENYETYKQYE